MFPERLCRPQGGIAVPVVGMGASLLILGVTTASRTGGDRDVPSGEGKEQQSSSQGAGSGSGRGKPLGTTNPCVDSPSISCSKEAPRTRCGLIPALSGFFGICGVTLRALWKVWGQGFALHANLELYSKE